jgi:hypothetical protein
MRGTGAVLDKYPHYLSGTVVLFTACGYRNGRYGEDDFLFGCFRTFLLLTVSQTHLQLYCSVFHASVSVGRLVKDSNFFQVILMNGLNEYAQLRHYCCSFTVLCCEK